MPTFRQFVRRSLVATFPELSKPLFRYTHRRHITKLERDLGLPDLNRRVAALTGGRVVAGPFVGMKYIDRATGSQYSPKLVGAYERELYPWIERAVEAEYDLFVDIGCAEGFYAVGFALRSPSTSVIAFDIDPKARELTALLAAKNGVLSRLVIQGECRPQTFAELPAGRLLVLCDCEGFEAQLLVPEVAPRLKNADLLVELHEQQAPGIKVLLIERFEGTHEIESVDWREREPVDLPVLNELSPADRALAVNEVRGYAQSWLMLTARDQV